MTMMAECMEQGAIGPLTAAFGHAYDLTQVHRAELLLGTHVSEGLGLLAAGLICDTMGRRGLLIWSTTGSLLMLLVVAAMPASMGFGGLVALRAASGTMLGMMSVATTVLVVESCPTASRPAAMFGVGFMANFGYLGTALGLHAFMPDFGEARTDQWRRFCLVMCVPFAVGVLSSIFVVESPHFLAVHGDAEGCIAALEQMGRFNGHTTRRLSRLRPRPSLQAATVPLPQQAKASMREELQRILTAVLLYPSLLCLLVGIDSCRTYYTSGVAYVSKDIFIAVGSDAMPGTVLFTLASLSPFVGLLIATPLITLGTRFIVFSSAFVGAAAVWMLTVDRLRGAPLMVLAMVMVAKFTFSPMRACVDLMKAEAFPTEVRGSMIAIIHFLAKIACMAAPILEELLRGRSKDAWSDGGLDAYLTSLSVAVLLCGLLALGVPATLDQGHEGLEDYMAVKGEGSEREGLHSSSGSSSCSSSVCGEESRQGSPVQYGAVNKRPPSLNGYNKLSSP